VENLVSAFSDALRGRRVLVTGHTGFKGSWLTWWLHRLGASVTGFSLAAEPQSMYRALGLDDVCASVIGDVRDRSALERVVIEARPELVFHLAAQSLVLVSYDDPLGTLMTNVIGTANLLDVLRVVGQPATVIVVTSDKCYDNDGASTSFREGDCLGGHDIYSASKAAAELVTASYRRSFFASADRIRVASARAGNVIGGGDFARHRVVPDSIRALSADQPVRLRNPRAVRPWQHVLEPLAGYLQLAARIANGHKEDCDAWNFGPADEDACTVATLVERIIEAWGSGRWVNDDAVAPHEAAVLRLSTEKAVARLGWRPRWPLATAVERTVEWYRAQHAGADASALRQLTSAQIDAYMRDDDEPRR
jgi:CDP-glucose 4,6-dehydratase